MPNVIIFIASAIILIFSFFGSNANLTKNGEYQSNIYILNKNITNMHIITHIEDDEFITRTYLSSPALKGTAVFLSEGQFIDNDNVGTFKYKYTIKELERPKALDVNNIGFYLGMVGRVGLPLVEEIKLIYHDNKVTVLDMNRNNNVIMFTKKH